MGTGKNEKGDLLGWGGAMATPLGLSINSELGTRNSELSS
jgi:hypothetical protein